ncbi:hypothetical protein MXB_1300 [Myxobolus squamalis]|nr:hypothetical protein MXB_1300 [Myxobolus squamalis]
MDDRSCWSYWHFLHFTFVVSDIKLKPMTITADFEKGFIKACTEQIQKRYIAGCSF